MTIICTEDGNWLAFVPGIGTVSGSTRDAVIREISRRKAAQGRAA
ncbi:hypothetical protein [Mesorhizobium sp.]|nr:hypothetical protein [Mesorhizobium sp.]